MNSNFTRLEFLFEKYFQKTASPQERDELSALVNDEANREQVMELFNASWEKYLGDGERIPAEQSEEMLRRIIGTAAPVIPIRRVGKVRWWTRIAAASVILLAVLGAYLFFLNKGPQAPKLATHVSHEVKAPQSNRATVTLANGQTVYLDSVANGQLASQGKVKLVKLGDGQIKYLPSGEGSQSEVAYNTLTNPRGSKVITMTLGDGSKVWLNAASSITYPVEFTGKERKITMTGEAYFVVAHNENMPFKVIANGVEVRDIGTEFNVNAYDDEDAIRVTLIQGSVKVSGPLQSNESMVIKPGEQVVAAGNGRLALNEGVNVKEVIAWKNGEFIMNNTGIDVIMRQISRWYDVDVTYKNGIPSGHLSGDIPRDMDLSKMLEVMKLSGVKYQIEGRNLIVSK